MVNVIIGEHDAVQVIATEKDTVKIVYGGLPIVEMSYEMWKGLTTPIYKEIRNEKPI